MAKSRRHDENFKRDEFRVRKYGFVGRIDDLHSEDIGFIRTRSIFRKDGGDIGLDMDHDIFVHINSFLIRPNALERGAWIAFFVGSSQRDGYLCAEMCVPCDPPDFARTG